MDVSLLIRQRLSELGRDQRELAVAAQVTESYISQLLARKKAPPAPARTDIYERIGEFLAMPSGELARLAEVQRQEELLKKVAEPPAPLFSTARELILRKCDEANREEVRRIFEKQPFGELERLVTQKILTVAQGVARQEFAREEWLRELAAWSGRSYEQMHVAMLEFLEAEDSVVSLEAWVPFLDPMLESWKIDLKRFGMEVVVKGRSTPGSVRRLEYVERQAERGEREPGLKEFLANPGMSAGIGKEELEYLEQLRFGGRRPTALYYYRELQSWRDPLHFAADSPRTAGREESG